MADVCQEIAAACDTTAAIAMAAAITSFFIFLFPFLCFPRETIPRSKIDYIAFGNVIFTSLLKKSERKPMPGSRVPTYGA